MNMKVFGRTQMLRYPLHESCGRLHECGFDGVELCIENQDIESTLTKAYAQRVCETLDRLEMGRSVSWHADYIRKDDAFELIKKALVLTPSFGADIFVCGGTRARGDENEWGEMVSRTRELAALAEACGVVLAKEFEPGFVVGSTADLLRLFEEIPSAHLKANLDLGHVFLCDPDPMQAVESLAGRIAHCHIENMATGVHRHLPPWEGDMDLGEYLSALAGVEFDGPLALDLYDENYEAVGREALQFLRRCCPN